MVPAVALILAAAFGGADQYLGSFSAHPWMADVSLLSAPWLAIAFLAGTTQTSPRRGAALGFACTAAALAGYAVMTLSPVENAHYSVAGFMGWARSSDLVLIGALVTGPLFGWFGQQWRVRRARLGAVVTALAICLEPLARVPAHREIRSGTVELVEEAIGLLAVGYASLAARRSRTVETR
ncbi:MAG TPA: hypothetical protein VG650_04530 [Mycobacteriales bacterium]|nr:hypothetical protein [Mycobacteriales bacterium]